MKRYYTIDFTLMKISGLSINEWMILENIRFLENEKGWCYATKKELAKNHDLSERGFYKIRLSLIEKKWLKTNKKSHLKTTIKWTEIQSIKHTELSSDTELSSVNSVPIDSELSSDQSMNSVPTYPIKKEHEEREEERSEQPKKVVTNLSASIVSNYLLKKIISSQPNFKHPNLNTWIADIDKSMRLDNRTEKELINCIDYIYSPSGEFWQSNILSGKKLREKFDTIEIQAKKRKHKMTTQEHAESIPDETIFEVIAREAEEAENKRIAS